MNCFRKLRMALLFSFYVLYSSSLLLASDEVGALQMHPVQARPVTLNQLVEEAYQNNPSIQAARKEWRAAIESYRIITAYPDPQIMVTYFTDPIETRLGPQDWNASISQTIPFPGQLSKTGDIVKAEAGIARLKLDKSIRDIIVGVKESFFELIYIRKAKQIAQQNLELLNHLRKVGETAYAQDRAQLMDVVKAQSQVGQLQYDVFLLDDLASTEMARLNGLLNRPPDKPLEPIQADVVRIVPYDLNTLYSLAEKNNEEIKIAQGAIEKADANLDLAYYQNLPSFKVGLFYASIGEPDVPGPPADAGKDAIGIQAGMSIPLWYNKSSGRVAKARAELKKFEAYKRVQINATNTRIRETYFRLQNAFRLMTLYQKELLPQAAKSMEIAETWFKAGQSSFTDFVEAQAVWYNFQLAFVRSRADYGKYDARLEQLVGQNLTVSPADKNVQDREGKNE